MNQLTLPLGVSISAFLAGLLLMGAFGPANYGASCYAEGTKAGAASQRIYDARVNGDEVVIVYLS